MTWTRTLARLILAAAAAALVAYMGVLVVSSVTETRAAVHAAALATQGRNASADRAYKRITGLTHQIEVLNRRSAEAQRQRARLAVEVHALVAQLRAAGFHPVLPDVPTTTTSTRPAPSHPRSQLSPAPRPTPHRSPHPSPSPKPHPSPSPTPSKHCVLSLAGLCI